MTRLALRLAICTALLLAAFASPILAGPTKTIAVVCPRDSINAALKDKAEELILEISGRCNEHVVIRRDNVLLRGTDPEMDGIVGPIGTPNAVALVEVWEAMNVRFENLTIAESEKSGLFLGEAGLTDSSTLSVVNCRLRDNDLAGGHLTTHSLANFRDTTFSGNTFGLLAQRNSIVNCDECLMVQNASWALRTWGTSIVNLESSVLIGPSGVWSFMGSRVHAIDSTVQALLGEALKATDSGELLWTWGAVAGSLVADLQGQLVLEDSGQSDLGTSITLTRGARMVAERSSLEGEVLVAGFSTIVLGSGSELDGSIDSRTGGDAWCTDVQVTGQANAEHCSK